MEIVHEAAQNAGLPVADLLYPGCTAEELLFQFEKLYKKVRPQLSQQNPTYTFGLASRADQEKRKLFIDIAKTFLQKKGGHVRVWDESKAQGLAPLSDVRLIFTLDFNLA